MSFAPKINFFFLILKIKYNKIFLLNNTKILQWNNWETILYFILYKEHFNLTCLVDEKLFE